LEESATLWNYQNYWLVELTQADEMRRPVSDGMQYAPKYPRARGTEKKETGNEEG
jgi:hypothetical protein